MSLRLTILRNVRVHTARNSLEDDEIICRSELQEFTRYLYIAHVIRNCTWKYVRLMHARSVSVCNRMIMLYAMYTAF